MVVRVGINGFGRIGRNVLRAAKAGGADLEFVAINDLGSVETMAHLLRYDTVAGPYPGSVRSTKSSITVDGDRMRVLSKRNPADLPWGELGVDVVIESTGRFRTREAAGEHLEAGARKVVISAPSPDGDATFVVGVNDDGYNPARHHVVSNASCTTNCLAPMAHVLETAFGVEQGLMTTVHAYTGDQNLVDGPHRDARRARAAAVNVVPTTTGAAAAVGQVLTKLDGKFDGKAVRVPVPAGSLVDLTVLLKKNTDVDALNAAFQDAARTGPLRKILDYSNEPLVSSDIIGRPASCVFDSGMTQGSGRLFKVFGWYDNEVGYSHRLVDLAVLVGKKKAPRKRSRTTKPARQAATKYV